MVELGAFCKTYGNTINNRILENQAVDFAVGDMARELVISKPKAYEVIKTFEENTYVKKITCGGQDTIVLIE